MTSTPVSTPTTTPKRGAKMVTNQTQNLNHLLNFTLPPRQRQPLTSLPRRSRRTGNIHGVWNKERFVNAQYRFVMDPSGDYTVHFADPDIYFQWNDILQVIIPRSSAFAFLSATGENSAGVDEGHTACPICLASPTAPRMTKCGHIFCFSCILHYLSTSENKWVKCPICFDSVNASQLKSVKWFDITNEDSPVVPHSPSSSNPHFDLREGATMRMRLIQRPQITTLALPRSTTWPSDLIPPHQAPFHFLPDVFQFSKFMLATPSQLISDLTRDLDDLAIERRILAGTNDDLGILFIDGAVQKVRNQIEKASSLDTPLLRQQSDKAHKDHREIQERVKLQERHRKAEANPDPDASHIPQELLSLKSVGAITFPASLTMPTSTSNANLRTTTMKQRRNINPPPPSTSTYYYYQAASGLPLYLHPVDIRILLSHFGEYSSFPDNITIRVDAFSEGTVNDDLRKRCKYLAHLPEGADVVFVEADLEGVVGAEGLKNFEHALKIRKARRREKGRKDERAKVRAEEREREKRLHAAQVSWESPQPQAVVIPPEPLIVAEPEAGEVPAPAPQQISGAWGQGSFASALRSTSSRRNVPAQRDAEDEWEMDIAWHELEQRSSGTGRKKRSNKLVVLGGGGGRRGR